MTTTPEDADALFDAPPSSAAAPKPPSPPASSASPPFAAENPLGALPVASAENRREQRVKVSWPGRVQLPNGRVINLKVRDISDGGVGLLSEVHIPAYTVLNFAMGVPPLN